MEHDDGTKVPRAVVVHRLLPQRVRDCYGDMLSREFCDALSVMLSDLRKMAEDASEDPLRRIQAIEALLRFAQHPEPPAGDEWVYFIRAEGGGPIKIGRSADPDKRLRELQTGHPYPLRVVGMASGGRELEAALHRILCDYRLMGEWFEDTGPVLELMRLVCAEPDRLRRMVESRAGAADGGAEVEFWVQ